MREEEIGIDRELLIFTPEIDTDSSKKPSSSFYFHEVDIGLTLKNLIVSLLAGNWYKADLKHLIISLLSGDWYRVVLKHLIIPLLSGDWYRANFEYLIISFLLGDWYRADLKHLIMEQNRKWSCTLLYTSV